MGTVLGAVVGITCAEVVSQTLISKTIKYGFKYTRTNEEWRRYMTLGAIGVWGFTVEGAIIVFSVAAGEKVMVLIGNVVYELCKKQHRALVDEWYGVKKAVEEG